jgi:DNA-binding winged helix-turn-helix (wHTH) protein/tetratricopeptide (TPR) repeat protein
VRFGEFELDESNARLLRAGSPVSIAPTPFALLCALARQPGALLTRHALLDQVWGHQFVSDSVLKTAISDLRGLLHDDARRPRFIETVARRGYRFIAAPTVSPAVATAATESEHQRPSSFIGRAQALSRLRRAWDAACSGRRLVVWIAGEPGIGKTTLIEHFLSRLDGATCARGQCVENFGAGEPYLPVLEAVSELCRKDETLPSLLRAVAPTWLVQLPWLSTKEEREALRAELAGVSPERMLREMGELLDRYTERRPLLLVTEDLQWSDRATIQLMDYLARRRGSSRLLWLSSFRLAEVVALDHPFNALRRELRLHGLCEEIVLDPFSEAEVGEYVAERWPAVERDEAFVRGLHGRTDGVPLFVASVMADLTAQAGQGDDHLPRRVRSMELAVPENLTALIDHYIARLSDQQRVVLSAAAVCGVDFRVDTVAFTLEREPASVSETIEELARMQLWLAARTAGESSATADASRSFRHALFRQVLYERTAPESRARLHRKVGQALARERETGVSVSPAELAMHFERGHEPMAALHYYEEAARTSLLLVSPAGCMNATERGLRLIDEVAPGPERDALELSLATLHGVSAFHLLGVGDEAKSSLRRGWKALASVPQHPLRGLLAHHYGLVLCLRGEYDEAVDVAENALALPEATKDTAVQFGARMVQGDVHLLRGQPRAACAMMEPALPSPPSLEPVDASPEQSFALVALLGALGIHLLHLGRIEQGRARVQQARAHASRLGQPMARLIALWFDAMFEVRMGDAERVGAIADEMHALVEEFDLALGQASSRWFRGWADAHAASPREGYRRIREAYDDNVRLGMIAGGSETLAYAAEALVLAGELDAAQREVDEAMQIVHRHDERVYLPQLFMIQASIARARGDAEAADAAARKAVAEARAQEAPWLELLALVELCEHQSATVEDRAALSALIERLPEARTTKSVARARALLESTPQA